ncbi:MAG: vWA domain-containing protein [Pseudomonadota bacterium]
MNNELTNPLQMLLKTAASTLPVSTGRVAIQQAKLDRRAGESVILADYSDSMASAAWGGQRKIDVLRQAVTGARQQKPARLIVFSASAREVDTIPEPQGNTNLVEGLRQALAYDPGVTLVISDGRPDRPDLALKEAAKFRGVIDALYIGPESDTEAIAFMRRLAAAAGGRAQINDLAKLGGPATLLSSIAGLLQ